jgi:hypothetical protein
MEWLSLSTLPRGKVSPGSACLLAAVPEEWVETWPDVDPTTQMISGTIVLKTDRQWLRMLLVSKKRIFKEESQRSNAGLSFLQSIQGRTAGHSIPLHLLVGNWANHRWVILYHEAGTGITYLIGKPGSGALLDFKYSNETGTITEVSLQRTAITRAPVYQGSYTLDTNQTIDVSTSLGVYPYYATGTEGGGGTTFTIPFLKNKIILWVSRSGVADLAPVDSAPANDTEIQYSITTGDFVLFADRPLSAGETLFILYKS